MRPTATPPGSVAPPLPFAQRPMAPLRPGFGFPGGPGPFAGGTTPPRPPGVSPMPTNASPRHQGGPRPRARSPSADSGRLENRDDKSAVASLQARLSRLEQENAALHQQLHSRRGNEPDDLRREVLQTAQALDVCIRDVEEQQARMMAHMRSLAQALVMRCQPNGGSFDRPIGGNFDRPPGGNFDRPISPKDGRPALSSGVTVKSPAPAPALDKPGIMPLTSPAAAPAALPPAALSPAAPPPAKAAGAGPAKTIVIEDGVVRNAMDPTSAPTTATTEGAYNSWFLSMKQNLEHFGDVEVFVEEAPRECNACFETMVSPYRIKPRKCSHVFHIECLLQWWTEGSCPVCRTSFAPDDDEQAVDQGGPRPLTLGGHGTAHSSISQRGDEGPLDTKRASPRGTPMRGGWSGPSLHGSKPPL